MRKIEKNYPPRYPNSLYRASLGSAFLSSGCGWSSSMLSGGATTCGQLPSSLCRRFTSDGKKKGRVVPGLSQRG